jgi:hypothetical protein
VERTGTPQDLAEYDRNHGVIARRPGK